MSSLDFRLPLPLRAVNRVGGALASVGVRVPHLEAASLRRSAEKRTGLRDLGDPSCLEALSRVTQSLEREAQLSLLGRLRAHNDIIDCLANRLGIIEHRKTHPEVAEKPIERPLFILGLPRTGTTILYELLAQDPGNRAPISWELQRPLPPPVEKDFVSNPRIDSMEKWMAAWNRLAPDLKSMHEVGARLPQECVTTMAPSFMSDWFGTLFSIPSYREWLLEQDHAPAYRWHAIFLQHLQSRCMRDRWLLKAPAHLGFIDSLLAQYPDAAIVQTHRDPMSVLASFSSLTYVVRKIASDAVDPVDVGRHELDFWSRMLKRGVKGRDAAGKPDQFFDLDFDRFVRDPIAAVERIYGHFDFELSAAVKQKMIDYLAAKPRDRHGSHSYALEDFGLDRRRDGRLFDEYCERFGIPSDGD